MSAVFHSVNGQVTPHSETVISPFDTGLLRGFGAFDYCQVYKGVPFHLEDHIDRLCISAQQIDLDLPYTKEQIYEFALDLVDVNEPIDAGLRLVLTGGISSDTIYPDGTPNLIILFQPFKGYPSEYYSQGMRVVSTDTLRYLSHVKTTNYLPAVTALKKARAQNAHDIVYLDSEGKILEGSTCNVFFIKDGVLHTSDSNQIVRGVTRNVVLELAQDLMPVEYSSFRVDELSACEEAFLCSSMKDLIPLVQVDSMLVGNGNPGRKTLDLRKAFRTHVEKYVLQIGAVK